MKQRLLAAVVLSGLAAPLATAQDTTWSFSASADFDSRDRGLTLTDFDAGAHLYVDVETAGGWFANAYVARADNQRFSDVQADLTLGYGLFTTLADLSFSARLTSFHGAHQSEVFPEFQVTASRDFGRAFARLGVTAAPDGRWNVADSASYYSFFDLDVPVPGLAALQIETSIGYDVREGRRDVFNWKAGASYNWQAVSLGVHFQQSALDQLTTAQGARGPQSLGDGRVTARLSFYF